MAAAIRICELARTLAWRAGDLGAFFKACALVVCFILLWLGVGNVLSIWLPTRDAPILRRRQSVGLVLQGQIHS